MLAPVQVWQDPSVVGLARKETDPASRGARIEYDPILGSGFGIRYAQRTTDIDKARSGTALGLPADEAALLNREGYSTRLPVSYRLPAAGRIRFEVRLARLEDDLDGKAMSGKQDEFYLTHADLGDRFMVATILFIAQQDFDATNPELDRNRKDDNLGLGVVILDRRLFNSKQWVGQAMLAWHRQDSNIDFCDAESATASIGAPHRL